MRTILTLVMCLGVAVYSYPERYSQQDADDQLDKVLIQFLQSQLQAVSSHMSV